MSNARFSVDWLSITFPDSKSEPNDIMLGKWTYTGKGLHGYRARWRDSITGATFQADGPEAMGAHLTLTGDNMHNLRANGLTDYEVICRMLHRHGKPSRIDLAMDILGSDKLTVGQFQADYQYGGVLTRTKSGVMVDEKTRHGSITGETFYLGSRSSNRFMRVYNKALEMNVKDAGAWVRLELELKSIMARSAAGSIKTHGVEKAIKGHIIDMADWRQAEFQELIGTDGIEPEKGARRDTKTEAWLTGVVAKTLARAIRENPEIWDKFLTALTDAQREISETLDKP